MDRKEMNRKAMGAARKYVELRGYDVVDEDGKFIAWFEFDEFVVCKVRAQASGLPTSKLHRSDYERAMPSFLLNLDSADFSVRFDCIDMHIISDERAIIRHNIGIQNDMA